LISHPTSKRYRSGNSENHKPNHNGCSRTREAGVSIKPGGVSPRVDIEKTYRARGAGDSRSQGDDDRSIGSGCVLDPLASESV
jgi:hypothetical protein